MVIAVASEARWEKFTVFLGTGQTIGRDPSFQSNAPRIRNRQALIRLIQELLFQRDANNWVVRLKNAQIPAVLIANVDEAFYHAQAIERGLIVELEHPLLKNVKSVTNPIRMSGTPATYRLPPPMLGEHTLEILSELNFSSEEIAEASLSGAV